MAEAEAGQVDDTTQAGETEASTQSSTEEATQETTTATEAPATEQAEKPAEQKDEGKPSGDRGLLGETEDSKTEGAPEEYEDFTVDGAEISAEDQAALKELAKAQGLSQEEAQKSVAYSRSVIEQINKDAEQRFESFKAENKQLWESQPNHAEKTLLAEKAIKHLGKDAEQYLGEAGHLYDAKILGVLSEMGKLLSEPKHVTGAETAPSADSRIYNNSPELYS